jgi:hypothetical protein
MVSPLDNGNRTNKHRPATRPRSSPAPTSLIASNVNRSRTPRTPPLGCSISCCAFLRRSYTQQDTDQRTRPTIHPPRSPAHCPLQRITTRADDAPHRAGATWPTIASTAGTNYRRPPATHPHSNAVREHTPRGCPHRPTTTERLTSSYRQPTLTSPQAS